MSFLYFLYPQLKRIKANKLYFCLFVTILSCRGPVHSEPKNEVEGKDQITIAERDESDSKQKNDARFEVERNQSCKINPTRVREISKIISKHLAHAKSSDSDENEFVTKLLPDLCDWFHQDGTTALETKNHDGRRILLLKPIPPSIREDIFEGLKNSKEAFAILSPIFWKLVFQAQDSGIQVSLFASTEPTSSGVPISGVFYPSEKLIIVEPVFGSQTLSHEMRHAFQYQSVKTESAQNGAMAPCLAVIHRSLGELDAVGVMGDFYKVFPIAWRNNMAPLSEDFVRVLFVRHFESLSAERNYVITSVKNILKPNLCPNDIQEAFIQFKNEVEPGLSKLTESAMGLFLRANNVARMESTLRGSKEWAMPAKLSVKDVDDKKIELNRRIDEFEKVHSITSEAYQTSLSRMMKGFTERYGVKWCGLIPTYSLYFNCEKH